VDIIKIILIVVVIVLVLAVAAIVTAEILPRVASTGDKASDSLTEPYHAVGGDGFFADPQSAWQMFLPAIFGEDAEELGGLILYGVMAFMLAAALIALLKWVAGNW